MKATKYEVTIRMEVLSLDAIQGLLSEVSGNLDSEFTQGSLVNEDGDCASWDVKKTEVEF